MTPAEVARVLEGVDLAVHDGRHQLRDRLLRLRLAGRIGSQMYRDLLAAVDGASKDHERGQKVASAPIVVEVERYHGNGHTTPAEAPE